ncbi:MAG TPA: GH116 family glycosyl-hydrolase, partial [Vicinamibacteria bacterium]|nr:GH116 family glycosyl-hydrolase [Vicinamibacteria bacterium]
MAGRKLKSPGRREFLAGSVATVGALGTVRPGEAQGTPAGSAAGTSRRSYNGRYSGETLRRVAFPLGGMGAGMLCLEGTGALSHVSLRHHPDVFNEPCVFAAVSVQGEPRLARVLEGPVPSWKRFGLEGSGNGAGGRTWGLPRFGRASFLARFPFGTVTLEDDTVPLKVEITGWSPFEAGDPDASSLPFAALEYRLQNPAAREVRGVFSWSARNFMAVEKADKAVRAILGGFVLWGAGPKDKPWEEGAFCARTLDPKTRVNHA